MNDISRIKLTDGAEIFEHNGKCLYKYNAKLKVSGDTVKVMFYQQGILSGFKKNALNAIEKKERAPYDPEDRFNKTGATARKRLYDYIATNLHKHKDHNGKKQSFKLITCTFRNDVKKLSEANDLYKKFIQRLNYHFTGDKNSAFLHYCAVPELQMKNDRYVWHFHILFFNLPFIPVSPDMVDKLVADGRLLKAYDKRDTLYYIWGNGTVDARSVKFSDSYDVASYLSKYLGKGLDGVYEYASEEKNLNKKRFLKSGRLHEPRVIIAFLNRVQREHIVNYFKKHSKHFKKKGEIGTHYKTFFIENDYIGKMFGIDCRAGHKHVKEIDDIFCNFNYGFN